MCRKLPLQFVLPALLTLAASTHAFAASAKGVKITPDEAHQRVDITIDGQPFTSYIWPDTLKKPVLYPLVTEQGVTVTRAYPLATLAGERVDHPHQAGLWFNYGNVNGFDFWNNSDVIGAEDRAKMGYIKHTGILSVKNGKESGELVVTSAWFTASGIAILDQTTRYVFSHNIKGTRTIEATITLKALERAIFHDDKEGLLGLRVARWLESPEEKGGVFTDANGRQTTVEDASSSNSAPNPATGVYMTSEGVKSPAVWSTRARWCALTGNDGKQTVTVAILDHPSNLGYPTYWHARGYGLFAANPLGRSIFDPTLEPLNFTLDQDQTVTFRYRILLLPGATTADAVNVEASNFAASK